MKRILLILLSIITIGVYAQTTSPTNIKWVKTDKITARTDTVVIDSVLKVRNGLRVGNEYSLPTTDGSNGQAIITNGSGVLTFGTIDVSTKQNLTDTTTYDATKYYVRTDTSHVTSTGADVKYGTLQITGQTTLNSGANSFTLPTTRGTSGYYLKTDGAGTTSWDAVSGGFKWLVTGGGTDKIYTAVQAASAGDVVIVDAGAYTETQNLAKDGVRLHFMNGAVVTNTTSAALFDITGFVNDFIVTGDATFVLTNRLVYTSSATTNNPYIEYYKASNTANKLIDIGNNTLTGNIVINGKKSTESSGTNCVYIYNYTTSLNVSILGGIYKCTGAGHSVYISTFNNRVQVKCESIETTNAGYYALYLNGEQSINANIEVTEIKGASLSLYMASYLTNEYLYNIRANVIGRTDVFGYGNYMSRMTVNLYGNYETLYNNNSNYGGTVINIYGGVKYLTTNTSANNYSTVNLYGSRTITWDNFIVMSATQNSTVNNYGTLSLYSYNDATPILGTITSGLFNNIGYIYNSTGNNCHVFNLIVNGGKFYNSGVWRQSVLGYLTNAKELITLSSGTVKNSGTLTNLASINNAYVINVTGNSTFIHDGGQLITNPSYSSSCINNASSTLTIKNYNPYYTNSARGGAGTYTETITGGGTEIVDTDITE